MQADCKQRARGSMSLGMGTEKAPVLSPDSRLINAWVLDVKSNTQLRLSTVSACIATEQTQEIMAPKSLQRPFMQPSSTKHYACAHTSREYLNWPGTNYL